MQLFPSETITILVLINGCLISVLAQPDLAPDLRLLDSSIFVQDVPLQYLTCPRDENCLSSSASTVDAWQNTVFNGYRRLMRFSLRVMNTGNVDFVPYGRWIWHNCHGHYHSVEQFAFYEILDRNGGRAAAGLKASFCLRDDGCFDWGRAKYTYECAPNAPQGISPGCWDDYMNDLDCQWIDITDLPVGQYIFKVTVNPDRVQEQNFENNAVVCDFSYDGYQIRWWNCRLQRP